MDGGSWQGAVIFHPPLTPDIDGFYYVGSPYSKYVDGLFMASEMVCKITAILTEKGIPVFSPIAHSHAVAFAGGLDPLDYEKWMALNRRLMAVAYGMIVVKLPGWEESVGVLEEIDTFHALGKPVHYLEVT